VVAVAVGVVLCAPGCTAETNEVMVVGHDANGTAVVGAVDCGFDDRIPVEVVSVSDATGSGQEVWRVERPGVGRTDPPTGSSGPAPPTPEPRFLGGIEMVVIGDPRPSGGEVVVPLGELLPEEVVVEASTFADDPDPIGEVRLRRSGMPNSYEVAVRDGTRSESGAGGLDAAGVALLVDEECRESVWDFDGDVFALVLGVAAGVVLLVAVPVGIVTARQFRRAGAAAEARRRGTR
jgi:hypothetical protein